jgi:hypothetical protein
LTLADEIRLCTDQDFDKIFEVINDAAQAYQGVIPSDRFKEPYMPSEELRHEIEQGSGSGASYRTDSCSG